MINNTELQIFVYLLRTVFTKIIAAILLSMFGKPSLLTLKQHHAHAAAWPLHGTAFWHLPPLSVSTLRMEKQGTAETQALRHCPAKTSSAALLSGLMLGVGQRRGGIVVVLTFHYSAAAWGSTCPAALLWEGKNNPLPTPPLSRARIITWARPWRGWALACGVCLCVCVLVSYNRAP